jgi:hypothetical protein
MTGPFNFRSKRPSIAEIVAKSLETHEMSRSEYLYLASAVLKCPPFSTECRSMNQVFDDLRSGRLRLID